MDFDLNILPSGVDDHIHPTYQHYRSSGSLLRNKDFHKKYNGIEETEM